MPAPTAAAPALIEALREGGIVAPRTTIREARRSGLRLELACALLEQESSGGRNVYGHDASIFRGAGKVTRENYARYKAQRVAAGNRSMQGVGPCQLTWWELQDAADAQGGCWRPEINMRTGFSHLASLTKRYGESDGARRYNGSGAAAEAYSRDLLVKARRWEAIIDRRDEPAVPRRRRFARPRQQDDSRSARPQQHDGRPAELTATQPAQHRFEALAAAVRERDAASGEAWKRLVAYGHRRRRGLHAETAAKQARGERDDSMRELLEALARIEGRLNTLVEVTIHEPEVAVADTAADVTAAQPGGEPAAVAPAATPPQKPPARRSVPELLREVEALDERRRLLREELIARYERADRQLAELRQEPRPARAVRPRRRERPPRADVAEGSRRERPPRADVAEGSRSERDLLGGKAIVTRLGDRGVSVRRSKIAMSRYLAAQGGHEHAALRRRLRREAATPRRGDVASPAWGRAVSAVQALAKRPVTGELDGELVHLLLPYWPRDHIAKRMARSTPAWRAIPGQLTPNFNVKELACKDAARTPYVKGLMREKGLTKKQARQRAKAMANRLEHLRRLGGDRPLVINSCFRTRAYNASLDGSATNSAHTRGFAADTTPPRGVSLDQHKAHVLEAFECGVGYYPPGRGYFIHGDFDTTLGGRRTW